MKKHSKILLIFSILLCWWNSYFTQVNTSASIDKNIIRIGEPILLKLKLQYSNQDKVRTISWPQFKDTITGKIEIIAQSKIDTLKNATITSIEQTYTVSAYDSGYFVIPAFKFIINHDSDNIKLTDSLFITAHTVPTDTSELTIKDIKPIFEEPFNFKWYMPMIIKSLIGLLILSAMIYFIYRYYKKKEKPEVVSKPLLSPHIEALAILDKIKEEEIWREGKIKRYYSEVSDCIRLYIERRYKISALEQTTFETMHAFKFKAIDNNSKDLLKKILELSDLVKFAKFTPIETDHLSILEDAYAFVKNTTPNQTENKEQNEPLG